jgi:hypothetical protein
MSDLAGETGDPRGHHCNACREKDHERKCPVCGPIGLGGPQGDPPGNCNPNKTDRNGDEPNKGCESWRKRTVVCANQVIPRGNKERAARCDKAACRGVSGNASRLRNRVRRRPSFSTTSVPPPLTGLHWREIQSHLEEPSALPAPMVFAPFDPPCLVMCAHFARYRAPSRRLSIADRALTCSVLGAGGRIRTDDLLFASQRRTPLLPANIDALAGQDYHRNPPHH